MANFDAIVIGGGVNGLAAGLRLVEHGWSVCLMEASAELGGAARTVENTLPGFRHDFGAGFLPLAAVSPAIAGRDLGRYGLAFRYAPVQTAHPFPGARAIALGSDVDETAVSIDAVAKGDGDVWRRLADAFGAPAEALVRAQMRRFPIRDGARLLAATPRSRLLELARIVASGAATVAGEFTSDEAAAFFVGPAMHAGLQPEVAGTALYALLLGLVGQRVGMPVAQGGTGAVPDALALAFRAAGGTTVTGRRIDRIVVERGRVRGVETAGDVVTSHHAVIAALDPRHVVALAGRDCFPSAALCQIDATRPGVGTFKVDWALGGQVPWDADACRHAAVVHIGDSVTEMSRSAWETAHNLLPSRPTLILGQQSLADPTRAPAGRHTLWGYARVPTNPAGDAARPRARGAWEHAAKAFLGRVEERIEAYAPGFGDLVLARAVSTPAVLEHGDTNLLGGDISSGSFGLDQQLVFRPGPAWWRWRTPVDGLYTAGAGVPPGAGVHGACGDLAARQALADVRRPRVLAGVGVGVAAASVAGVRRRRGVRAARDRQG